MQGLRCTIDEAKSIGIQLALEINRGMNLLGFEVESDNSTQSIT